MKELEVVIATGNKDKIKEYAEILTPLGIKITSMKDEGISVDIDENGTSFEENSLIKARAIAKLTNKIVIADDSGICLEALDGFPGIKSARFMEGAPYEEKNLAIIKMLEGKDKKAHYTCAIALINQDEEKVFVGYVYGTICEPRSKGKGFGYDPIFRPDGYNETFGEMDENIKNKISHRGEASNQLIEYFKSFSRKN